MKKGQNHTTKKAAKKAAKTKPKTAPKTSQKKTSTKKTSLKTLALPKTLLVKIYNTMLVARVLEERLIKIYKSGESYFWLGGPGEEAFGVPLGMLANKGNSINHDWLHLHYRCTPTLVAMGMPMLDSIRLMMSKTTDPSTGGRNFSNHYAYPKWNVAPVTSTIETQYQTAIGTAWAQKKNAKNAISIVTGGDAGTAEGDFASALVWSSRKGQELPMLMIVTNNRVGISTKFEGQHGEINISDRGKAFGIRTQNINGFDPIESYIKLKESMQYIRKTRKPILMEAAVSRLYGHSSATGALFVPSERDPLIEFENLLFKHSILKETEVKKMRTQLEAKGLALQKQVRSEPSPTPESAWNHVYANNENADWRNF